MMCITGTFPVCISAQSPDQQVGSFPRPAALWFRQGTYSQGVVLSRAVHSVQTPIASIAARSCGTSPAPGIDALRWLSRLHGSRDCRIPSFALFVFLVVTLTRLPVSEWRTISVTDGHPRRRVQKTQATDAPVQAMVCCCWFSRRHGAAEGLSPAGGIFSAYQFDNLDGAEGAPRRARRARRARSRELIEGRSPVGGIFSAFLALMPLRVSVAL